MRGLSWGGAKVSGCQHLLSLLLSSLVVTGATNGIGKAYAHEVSQGVEPRGWGELLLVPSDILSSKAFLCSLA